MSDFRNVPTDFLLREVKRARDAGRPESARAEWEACIVRATARVRTVVNAYVAPGGDRIPRDDRDTVVYAALERGGRRLLENLDTFVEPVFVAAMCTVADFACRDHIRAIGAREKHAGGSLDDPDHPPDLHEEAARRDADVQAAFEAAEALESAIARMGNERQRRAIELSRLGHTYEEIASELDVSVANAYQLFSRGLRDLRGLIEP